MIPSACSKLRLRCVLMSTTPSISGLSQRAQVLERSSGVSYAWLRSSWITPSTISTTRWQRSAMLWVVGDDHDRLAVVVQLVEDLEDLVTRLAVEIAGGLVGQDQRRPVHEGARDGRALALPPRELGGPVLPALHQAHPLQRLERASLAIRPGQARVDQGQLHVAQPARPWAAG